MVLTDPSEHEPQPSGEPRWNRLLAVAGFIVFVVDIGGPYLAVAAEAAGIAPQGTAVAATEAINGCQAPILGIAVVAMGVGLGLERNNGPDEPSETPDPDEFDE